MLTKMNTMKAVLIRQKSIFTTSVDGRGAMSDGSSQFEGTPTTNDLEIKARQSLKGLEIINEKKADPSDGE